MGELRVLLSNALRLSESALHVGGTNGMRWTRQAMQQLDAAAVVAGSASRTGRGLRIAGVEPMRAALDEIGRRPHASVAEIAGIVRTAAAYGRAATIEAATIGSYNLRSGMTDGAARAYIGPSADAIAWTVSAAFRVARP